MWDSVCGWQWRRSTVGGMHRRVCARDFSARNCNDALVQHIRAFLLSSVAVFEMSNRQGFTFSGPARNTNLLCTQPLHNLVSSPLYLLSTQASTIMETVKNVVASVNEGVANVAKSAQEALGTVHDKVGVGC